MLPICLDNLVLENISFLVCQHNHDIDFETFEIFRELCKNSRTTLTYVALHFIHQNLSSSAGNFYQFRIDLRSLFFLSQAFVYLLQLSDYFNSAFITGKGLFVFSCKFEYATDKTNQC